MSDNWYEVLELDPYPDLDRKVIEARIEEKKKYWGRNSNHPINGQKYELLLGKLSLIRKAMDDKNERKAMCDEILAKRFAPIDRNIELAASNGELTEEQMKIIVELCASDEETVRKRASELGVSIVTEGQRKAICDRYTSQPDKFRTFEEHKVWLENLGYENLYDFLFDEREKPETLSLKQLNQKIKDIREKTKGKTDAENTAREKLCTRSEAAFKDENSRASYDEYLRYCKRMDVFKRIEDAAPVNLNFFTADKTAKFIEALSSCIGVNAADMPDDVLRAFCGLKGIGVEMPARGAEPGKPPIGPSSPEPSRPVPAKAEEQFSLGLKYERGDGVEKDYVRAFELFQLSAEQGHALAQNRLGTLYNYGRGTEKDQKKAFECFLSSAKQGSGEAQYNLAFMYNYGNSAVEKDPAKAAEWYGKAAAQGHEKAKAALENLRPKGTTPQPKPAPTPPVKDPTELYNLGRKYFNGDGVAKDDEKAFEYFRDAAERGHASAQNWLGFMYDRGRGVVQDDAKAVEWYRKSAEQGNAHAQNSLGDRYHYGDKGVAFDYVQAVEWYCKSAEQGNAQGQYNLGRMYEYGMGVAKDETRAVEWYRKADAQGYKEAKAALDKLQPKPTPTPSKPAQDPEELYKLGLKYSEGDGVPKDKAKAFEYFLKSAERGNADAQFRVYLYYDIGLGPIKKDKATGEMWLRKYCVQKGHNFESYKRARKRIAGSILNPFNWF
jgi:TPR repeat protein